MDEKMRGTGRTRKLHLFFVISVALGLTLFLGTTTALVQDMYIDDPSGNVGDTLTADVLIYNAPNPVDAFGFDVMYNSGILNYTGCTSGNLTQNFDFFDCNEINPGQVRVGGLEAGADTIAAGSNGSMVALNFTVKSCISITLTLQDLVDDISTWQAGSGAFTCGDITLPTITIISPTNTTYDTSIVDFNVSTDETIDTWWYSLNGGLNTTFVPNTTLAGIVGSNKLIVYANNGAGNENSSMVYFTLSISGTNIIQNITEGNLTSIDLQNESKMGIELMPNVNATLNLSADSSTNATLLNITDLTAAYGLGQNQTSLGRFTSINISGVANNESDIKWVILKLYYEDSDLDNIDENTLTMYWYCNNCTDTKWFLVTSGNSLVSKGGPKVYGTGKNTTENYIWANLSHFSSYGIGGDLIIHNTSLLPGWNLISIPLDQNNWSIPAVLASIDGNYSVVYAYVNGTWEKSTAARNPLTDMDLEHGYWVYMTAPDTLELAGTVPPTTINVSTGWNLAGYPSLATQNSTTVLSQVDYSVVFAYIDGAWKKSTAARNPLTEMAPGYGYWIYTNDAGSYEV